MVGPGPGVAVQQREDTRIGQAEAEAEVEAEAVAGARDLQAAVEKTRRQPQRLHTESTCLWIVHRCVTVAAKAGCVGVRNLGVGI